MFAYFLDARYETPAYLKKITTIKNLLRAKKISGEIYSYGSIDELRSYVEKNTSIGAQTFVSIGSDADLSLLINVALSDQIAFGYIPLEHTSNISNLLGLTSHKDATIAIAQRKLITHLCPIVNTQKIISEVSFMLRPQTNATFQMTIDKSLDCVGIGQRVVISNNLLVPNETKRVELQLFRVEKRAGQPLGGDKIELPTKPKHRSIPLKRSYEELILHIKADTLHIHCSEVLHDSLFDNAYHTIEVATKPKPIQLITKKQTAQLK